LRALVPSGVRKRSFEPDVDLRVGAGFGDRVHDLVDQPSSWMITAFPHPNP
jgi:hypothetical protein